MAQIPTYATNYAASLAASDELVAKLKLETAVLPKFEGSYVLAPSTPIASMALPPVPREGVATTVWTPEAFNNSADDDDPCEFKIVVLQALFQTDLQRGIMAATEWLKPGSTQTVRCKGANAKPAAIVFLQPINKDLQAITVLLIVACFTY